MRTKHTESRTHCVLAKLLKDLLAETQTRLATKLKLSRLLLSLCSQEYDAAGVTSFDSYSMRSLHCSHNYAHGFQLCFYIVALTFQHFHSHFCAGLGMSETIGSCLDHPAKGS